MSGGVTHLAIILIFVYLEPGKLVVRVKLESAALLVKITPLFVSCLVILVSAAADISAFDSTWLAELIISSGVCGNGA